MPETSTPLVATGTVAPDSVKKAQKLAFENNKLEKRLFRLTGQAIGDYNMIEQGDRVMVCMSGGKDSYAMLDILLKLRERAPIDFSIVAVNLDQKQPGFPEHVLPDYFRSIGVDFHIENQDTYSIVKRVVPEGKTTCSLCSRLRRGILYRVAGELGATKVALGHHRDDIIETVFLNLFYGGKLKGMPPKLQSDDGKNVVIRPLAYVRETDLERYAEYKQFPIIPCTLCGSQPNLKRAEMKSLIRLWEKQHPGRIKSIFSALSNVVPSHLMDTNLHDFKHLRATGQPDPLGDIAFDEAPCGDENDAGIIRITQFDD
ncbi:tRNA 2-thiocytidine(32) synthetase TtcA [Pandoraea cepalis]|uniref:tRNA-cytidine(32) 2-sulfurtransferase n=1 Tax=Pandoraea cepalis TaxID=2508294 RepID=A0AAW7MSX3_9BURK|nr:tRNA 2-thiocytidine(32) synthetase TtcA [Pandoraea cepalis]MDN4575972.1 tRNA 2-thiocytidine(32) synthetase TtcA [Pandoraea cepalis]MDN4581074.1 tRNA 2-thiocytidine(32) synthetase TtcA [Pandoraea cepalis]